VTFTFKTGERESFDGRLREMDEYVAAGDYEGAAHVLDLLVVHARRVAGKLLWAAKIPPPDRAHVGDLIGGNTNGIAANVVEVVNCEGDLWRRAVGDERYAIEDDGTVDRSVEYDWVTAGGWSSTEGLLAYTPLRVTKISVEDQ
jgi:hypothetical protein